MSYFSLIYSRISAKPVSDQILRGIYHAQIFFLCFLPPEKLFLTALFYDWFVMFEYIERFWLCFVVRGKSL